MTNKVWVIKCNSDLSALFLCGRLRYIYHRQHHQFNKIKIHFLLEIKTEIIQNRNKCYPSYESAKNQLDFLSL